MDEAEKKLCRVLINCLYCFLYVCIVLNSNVRNKSSRIALAFQKQECSFKKFDIKSLRNVCVSTVVFIMLRHGKLEVGGKNGT
jgi:hypothetical protein